MLQESLAARENEKQHKWKHQTTKEASEKWLKIYLYYFYTNPS